jgi:drug/metabolite transporter (DMT)-like permease
VGWRRWTAIIVGFIGVLLIILPGTDGFNLFSIFAILGMIGFAGRDLATRMSPNNMSNLQLGSFGFLMVFIAVS